jgi:hypothetical protein
MTPKEKAKELFEKFQKPVDLAHKYPMCFDTAKQCALITVDEILNSSDWHNMQADFIYYQQVKQEIQEL